MKQLFITAMAVLCVVTAPAFTVSQPRLINTGIAEAGHPVISPDGATLLFTTPDHTGLYARDMHTGIVTILDNSTAAGFCPVFAEDGTIVYSTAQLVDGLTCRDVRSIDLTDGEMVQRREMSRRDIAIDNEAGITSYARANYNTIAVTIDGNETNIAPLADAHSYLWASLSPDGKHILFNEPFRGVFVCNPDGTGARCISPKGDYPAWAGNDTVVFVSSTDDGYVILTSQMFAVDINGNDLTALTSEDFKVAECAATDGVVVFTTLDGKMYSVTIK